MGDMTSNEPLPFTRTELVQMRDRIEHAEEAHDPWPKQAGWDRWLATCRELSDYFDEWIEAGARAEAKRNG